MKPLTELQQKLLTHMQQVRESGLATIATAMGVSQAGIQRSMGGLITGGHIVACRVVRTGQGADIIYRLMGIGPQKKRGTPINSRPGAEFKL